MECFTNTVPNRSNITIASTHSLRSLGHHYVRLHAMLPVMRGVMFPGGIQMDRDLADKLFEALAILDRPLANACERSLDYARDNKNLREKERKDIVDAAKDLLKGHQLLHHYLSRRYPELDFIGDGEERYKVIKAENNVFKNV